MIEIYKLSDIIDQPQEFNEEVEAAFRRGYQYGMMDAAHYGIGDPRYLDWIADKLLAWRNRSRDEFIEPPVFPTWRELAKSILDRDKRKCRYCGKTATCVDHVIPVSLGGGYDPGNLVAACRTCNRLKGNSLPGNW